MSVFYRNGAPPEESEVGHLPNVKFFDSGFIFMYPMPAFDESYCELSKVIWNDPFVSVQLYNGFSISGDAIKFYQQQTNDFWDITPIEEKLEVGKDYEKIKELIAENLPMFQEFITTLEDKSVKKAPESIVEPVSKLQKFFSPVANRKNRLFFWIIQGLVLRL